MSVENNGGLYAELDALCRSQDRDPTMTDYRRRTEIAQWIKRKTGTTADTQNIAAALIDHPPPTVLSDFMSELQIRSELVQPDSRATGAKSFPSRRRSQKGRIPRPPARRRRAILARCPQSTHRNAQTDAGRRATAG